MKQARAFTLVEILIVVVLLGIMAAIVIPAIGRSATGARETTLAMNLNLLRRFIPVYTSQHKEVTPGYPDGDTSADPTEEAFVAQAMLSSNANGQTAARGTVGFPFGPYLSKIPANPFNGWETLQALANGDAFPPAPDDTYGWIYKAETGEIRAGNTGANIRGVAYYDY
jgi:general secretion pathway protein G